MAEPGAPRAEKVPEVRATEDRLGKIRVISYADFFCLARRFRCAAAILSRASTDRNFANVDALHLEEKRSCHNRSCLGGRTSRGLLVLL